MIAGEWLGALMLVGAVFVVGVSWGLFLNVTHMHRMRRWAESVVDRLEIQ